MSMYENTNSALPDDGPFLANAPGADADRYRAMRAAVFTLVLCFGPALGMAQSPGATGASFSVGATVLPQAGIAAQSLPQSLEVSARDVARGFVEVPNTVRLAVTSTSRDGFALDFWPRTTVFTAIIVRGAGPDASLDGNGGTIVQRGRHGVAMPLLLGFRFNLAPGTTPGIYPWPVQIDARPVTRA